MLGVVLQFGQVHRRRGQRDEQHRRVGRVHLAVARRLRHLGRQRTRGAQQRGLHVHRRGVDVAAFVEFQRHAGVAQRAGAADHGQARDGLKLLFQHI